MENTTYYGLPVIPPLPAPTGWAAAIRFASGEVDKLAAHFIRSRNPGDTVMYEQGIGCERAGKMLRELANLIERQGEPPNK